MATLNIFQQYSQQENTVTNNVLLMLSLLYDVHPRYYEEFIGSLIEEPDVYSVIPLFNQQVGNKGDGIIDAHIKQKASSIIIETKLGALEWIKKLLKYTKSFEENEEKILFHLSKQRYEDVEIEKIKARLTAMEHKKGIRFKSITYQDMIDQLDALLKDYPFEKQIEKIHQHFSDYCAKMNLLPDTRIWLRAMACGQSFSLNVKHQFYFDLASRGYSPFKYLGIYRHKAVQYIGLVENMIVADFDASNETLIIHKSEHPVTQGQKDRLIAAIKESIEEDWWVMKDHRFFLLNEFTQTHFEKTSPGGIFRVRYFNLEEYGISKSSSVSEIAARLNDESWE